MNTHLGPHTLKIVQNNLNVPKNEKEYHHTVNDSVEGETIEQQIERMLQNKEPMTGAEALTYTERKEGVKPEYNIRTDRWEIAIDATDKIQRSYQARRDARAKEREEKANEKEIGKTEPLQGTQQTPPAGTAA